MTSDTAIDGVRSGSSRARTIGEPVQPRASETAVLDFAWDAGVFTSGDVISAAEMTRSTAIEAIDGLISRGLLRELPNARAAGEYSKGRPSRRFELDAQRYVVIGVDAGRAHLTAQVADLRGTPIAQITQDLDVEHETADSRRDALVRGIADALRAAGRPESSVIAVCVGVPAPVDAHGRSPAHHDGFWQRTNPDLRDLLAPRFPIVRIENDASLAALAEGAFGAAVGEDDYVALLAGDRLGAGIVVGGRLLRGAHGGAGEMVALDHVTGVDTADGLGLRMAGWARDDLGNVPAGHPLAGSDPAALTARDVLRLADEGDEWASRIVERAGAILARIAGLFGSLFDPALVVVSGGVSGAAESVLAAARRLLPGELDLPAPRLATSPLGSDVVALGAVAGAVASARRQVLRIAAPTAA